jgi:hypothetical protein
MPQELLMLHDAAVAGDMKSEQRARVSWRAFSGSRGQAGREQRRYRANRHLSASISRRLSRNMPQVLYSDTVQSR